MNSFFLIFQFVNILAFAEPQKVTDFFAGEPELNWPEKSAGQMSCSEWANWVQDNRKKLSKPSHLQALIAQLEKIPTCLLGTEDSNRSLQNAKVALQRSLKLNPTRKDFLESPYMRNLVEMDVIMDGRWLEPQALFSDEDHAWIVLQDQRAPLRFFGKGQDLENIQAHHQEIAAQLRQKEKSWPTWAWVLTGIAAIGVVWAVSSQDSQGLSFSF